MPELNLGLRNPHKAIDENGSLLISFLYLIVLFAFVLLNDVWTVSRAADIKLVSPPFKKSFLHRIKLLQP